MKGAKDSLTGSLQSKNSLTEGHNLDVHKSVELKI